MEFPYAVSSWTHPHSGRAYRFRTVLTDIELGPYMLGTERFFTLVGGEPELAEAFMHKSFEICTSLADFLCAYFGMGTDALEHLVGDFGTYLSPRSYEQYSLRHGLDLLNRYGHDLPCNLHSCGPSAHLYEYWRRFPNIVCLQTRGIRGQLERLRQILPRTYLEITLHPPQFDFEWATPAQMREAVWSYAREAGFRELCLVVIMSGNRGKEADENVRAFYAALDEINGSR